MQVLLQVMTLFLLMMCGLMAVRLRVVDDRGVSGLNALVLYFAQPALILSSMQQAADPQLVVDLMWVFFFTVVIISLSGILASRLFRRETPPRRSVLTHLSMVSNCGFMGYPVVTAALGEGALIYAVIYVAAFQVMCWTLGAYYYGGRDAIKVRELMKNPSLMAVVVGLVLFLTGWRFPEFVNDGLRSMGATTTPVAMFVIGARLNGLRREHLTDKPVLLACVLRLVFFPLLALPLRFTPLNKTVVDVLFLCTAMPGAALTAMMAELYDRDVALASRSVALSTALSMLTVPLMLLLL